MDRTRATAQRATTWPLEGTSVSARRVGGEWGVTTPTALSTGIDVCLRVYVTVIITDSAYGTSGLTTTTLDVTVRRDGRSFGVVADRHMISPEDVGMSTVESTGIAVMCLLTTQRWNALKLWTTSVHVMEVSTLLLQCVFML